MNTTQRTGKAARQTTTNAGPASPTAVSDKGLAIAAPASGITVVDRRAQAGAEVGNLPAPLKRGIESLAGLSLDGVTVHYGSSRPGQVGAAAFAQGRDIHLGPGQDHHLPHEAWHVVQQAQGRVAATARASGGQPVNDDLALELEADAMGAKAMAARPAAPTRAAQGDQASPATTATVPLPARGTASGGGAAVIQRWPKWLDRLRARRGHQQLESADDRLTHEVKTMGHRAQTQQTTIEAQRRDKVGEGLGQVVEEGVKMGLDAVSLPTTGVPVGTVLGAVRSAQTMVSSGHEAYRETASKGSATKAVGKEVLKEGVGQALGNVPVVGEFIGMGQGLVTAATGVLESEASRGKEKQKAIDKALAEQDLAERARQRLAEGDLEPAHQRRLEKGVERHEKTLGAARKWQQGKAAKGVLPLLSQEAPDLDDDELAYRD
jgi:hypothetical protein